MATIHLTFGVNNLQGTTNLKVRYRESGTQIWQSLALLPSSGVTSVTIPTQNNILYDVQEQNINGADNPYGLISQTIGFSDPNPILYPTNITLGYTFGNLSQDISTYVCTIALQSSPSTILSSHILKPTTYPQQISDTFTGLLPVTAYVLTITPTANQFTGTFTYNFTTEAIATCPDVSNLTVTLIYP